MSDESKLPPRRNFELSSHPAVLPVGLIVVFFGGCAILFPDFVMASAVGAFVSLIALSLYGRSDAPKRLINADKPGKSRAQSSHLQLVDALQFPAFLLDSRGNVTYFNSASLAAFGKVGLGDRITIRFRQPEFKAHLEKALQQLKPASFTYHEAVPSERWFDVEFSPISNASTKRASRDELYLLGFHDQTETRRMDQMRSDFIANASHELRTPLSSILGFIETIRGPARNDPESVERFTGVMLEQAERMSRLVNDLLSLSRIEMKSHVRPSDTVSMREVLTSVVEGLESSASSMGVSIDLELEDDVLVKGDRDGLIQVFENLAENACKYGQEGERVEIKAKKVAVGSSEYLRVSVRDFGPGIAMEHQHRITERFYRVDVARSREKQGTGLGLAIVKNILQRHGTRLQISSEVGGGAEFSVDLSIAEVGNS